MENPEHAPPLERNPITHQRHRREVFWQITVPIVLGGIIILALAILTTQTPASQASVWADISLIWFIAPIIVITLLSLVLLGASIYLNARLLRVLPFYSRQVQDWFIMVSIVISRIDDKTVEPILRLKTLRASIGALHRNQRRK